MPERISTSQGVVLNDVHSRLNPTKVDRLVYPRSTQDIVRIIRRAKKENKAISISGGRHAMGGQQFGEKTIHISMEKMNDVLSFDQKKGIIRIEAGITWPQLIQYLHEVQKTDSVPWGIIQKQTGADHLSLGGALSANAHGKGSRFKPMIQDVESFTLVDAEGKVLKVSRNENKELFQLAIGGYGLFGVIATVDLRLQRRSKFKRIVEVITTDELPAKVQKRLAEGFLYGDFQYKTDEKSPDFMRLGVFSTYQPVAIETPIPEKQKRLTPQDWNNLLVLAHTDKSQAFELYSRHYLTTDGQIYWSDELQMGYYNPDYIEYIQQLHPEHPPGSLMITEVYVPRAQINEFIEKVRREIIARKVDVIYGTMRLIERDDESFLAWAKEDYACVIFNLQVEHSTALIQKAKEDFQKIIDCALDLNGSFYLTYHRWARRDQIFKAYPQFVDFLKLKLRYDPQERFQSEWYRHYKKMFAKELRAQAPTPPEARKSFDEGPFEQLKSLHQPKKPSGPFDWLSMHPEEGQTFEQYLGQNPTRPDPNHQTIYVVLLGDFDPTRKKIIEQTAEFLRIYFQLPVKFADPISLSVIPPQAQRVHPLTGDHQILTTYVIEKLLAPRRPKDAFGLIAFTPSDLWPGEGWNFVFGQASLEDRVGVWSIYRNGDPTKGPEDFKLCLLRTLKTGSHEIGHMFSLAHCIFYECNMNGSNHRRESDERPLWLCPVCLKKLHWAVGLDMKKRFKELAEFCDRNGLIPQRDFYKRSLQIIT